MTDKDDSPEHSLSNKDKSAEAGPPGLPPPSFEARVGDAVVVFDDVANTSREVGEEAPKFTLYEAEHRESSGGKVISHDHHLNEDGEALYRFLLSQAETPPTFFIHCHGTHSETRTRMVNRTNAQGGLYTTTETYTETITDFDFKIRQPVPPRATQWTVADEEPAFRGCMKREVGLPGNTIELDGDTKKRFKAWRVERHKRGLPPWVGPNDGRREEATSGSTDGLRSSWTLRQWADNYCQSQKIFKEFEYEKVIYGWDLDTLETAIQATIRSTHYDHRVEINFQSAHTTVIVRPDRPMSRALSNGWLKFLLIITLIYPCIWLFQRFSGRGGGRWVVGGSSYALKRRAPSAEGEVGLIGEEEGEWMRRWEGTIRRSVMGRKIDRTGMIESPNSF